MNSISLENHYIQRRSERNIHCLSTHNRFIPFYTLYNSQVYKVNNRKVINYGKLSPNDYSHNHYGAVTHVNLLQNFHERIQVKMNYTYKNPENIVESMTLLVGRGYISDMDNYLCMVIVNSDYINSINSSLIEPNPNKFKFLIDYSFTTDIKYKKIWTMIKNRYLPILKIEGVDIIYTDSIDNWVFNSRRMIPVFNTTEERDAYLNSLNNFIDEEEEPVVFSPPIPQPYYVGVDPYGRNTSIVDIPNLEYLDPRSITFFNQALSQSPVIQDIDRPGTSGEIFNLTLDAPFSTINTNPSVPNDIEGEAPYGDEDDEEVYEDDYEPEHGDIDDEEIEDELEEDDTPC